MPQLLGLILLGAAAVAGYKSFYRVMSRTPDAAGRTRKSTQASEPAGIKDLGPLELDPRTGIYKPRR